MPHSPVAGSNPTMENVLTSAAAKGSAARIGSRERSMMREYQLGMQRSGHADLPLHGGRVLAWLAERMDEAGNGDRRACPAALRPFRTSFATERSLLVSGSGLRHGDGLALLRHHHQP